MIIGVIEKIEDFLSSNRAITIEGRGEHNTATLDVGRQYFIPYYQREIRWEDRHVSSLISDIKNNNEKLLGNMILAGPKNNDNNDESYEIIDGQQRITTILMIIHYLQNRNGLNLVFNPVAFRINSFEKYQLLIDADYDSNFIDEIEKVGYKESDKYLQRERLISRYCYIKSILEKYDDHEINLFSQNLLNANINLIVSTGGDSKGMEYFLDVNLKGIKLETEDIFKGYFFKKMSISNRYNEAVSDWENLKKAHNALSEDQRKAYPLTLFLEHYMRCTLHLEKGCFSVQINENFELESDRIINDRHFYKGDHLLTIFGSYVYPQKVVKDVTEYINKVFIPLVNNNEGDFINLFGRTVNNITRKLAFNCMGAVLKGRDSLVKAIMMKYGLELLSGRIQNYESVFAAYFYCILFSALAVVSKQKEKITDILKANNEQWATVAIKKGLELFENAEFSNTKMYQKYLIKSNVDVDGQYLAKCLALIYNSFSNITENGTFAIDQSAALNFCNSQSFSIEHLFINRSGKVRLGSVPNGIKYPDPSKKAKNSLYNFIFIPQDLNRNLENLDIPNKIKVLLSSLDDITCSYSKKAIEIISDSESFRFPDWDFEDDLDLATRKVENYFSAPPNNTDDNYFLNIYAKYATKLMDAIKEKITGR